MLRTAVTVVEWLRRFRAQAVGEAGPFTQDLEVVPSLQPTVLLADHSFMAPYADVAQGIGGFTILAAAGQFSAYGLTCLSPGGLIIHGFQLGNRAGIGAADEFRYNWSITNSFGGALGGVHSVDPERPALAAGATRTNAASWLGDPLNHEGDLARLWTGGITGTRIMPSPFAGPIYVPANRMFCIEGMSAGQGMDGWCYFTCLPAARPSRVR